VSALKRLMKKWSSHYRGTPFFLFFIHDSV
jgi:hypothetical protein